MKPQRLIIPTELPSLNEYIRLCRGDKYAASTAKGASDEVVRLCAKAQKIKPIKGKIYLRITYFDKDLRTDNDNRAFTKKYIYDGLKKAGVIRDDSRRYLIQPRPWTEDFKIDRKQPRVEIMIYDMED